MPVALDGQHVQMKGFTDDLDRWTPPLRRTSCATYCSIKHPIMGTASQAAAGALSHDFSQSGAGQSMSPESSRAGSASSALQFSAWTPIKSKNRSGSW